MKTIKITKADLNENNEYKKGSIGTWDNYEDTHVEIEANLGWVSFKGVYVKGQVLALAGTGIKAGWGIKAGEGIEAGWGIKAGTGIEAGEGIEAGWGIKAGEGIECKLALSFGYNLFAGTATWTKKPTKTITCGKLEKGTICYGDLIETGLPEEERVSDATAEAIELLKKNGYKIIKD